MADESKKKTIIIYADWINKFEELDDDEAGRLIKHFFRYVNNLNPVAPDRITKISFIDIENSLKRNLEKYEKTVAGRSKAGKASVLARELAKKQTLTNSTNVNYVEQTLTNLTDSDSDSDNDNVNDNKNKNKKENNIEERKLKFASTLEPFKLKYGKEMIDIFFKYWTQPNKSNTKFRQELEATWELSYRLETWAKRDKSSFIRKEQPTVNIKML